MTEGAAINRDDGRVQNKSTEESLWIRAVARGEALDPVLWRTVGHKTVLVYWMKSVQG